MTDVGTLGKLAWRDWATDGVPSSGSWRSLKSDIRAFADAVELQKPTVCTTLAALKATTVRPAKILTLCRASAGDFGGGLWVFRTGNQAARVTADPLGGVWAAPDSDPTGASSAWERKWEGEISPHWYGAKGDDPGDGTGTEDQLAVQATYAWAAAIARMVSP
jgi:hypothetical protein